MRQAMFVTWSFICVTFGRPLAQVIHFQICSTLLVKSTLQALFRKCKAVYRKAGTGLPFLVESLRHILKIHHYVFFRLIWYRQVAFPDEYFSFYLNQLFFLLAHTFSNIPRHGAASVYLWTSFFARRANPFTCKTLV